GVDSFCCLICFRKTSGANSPQAKVNVLATTNDFILWYAKQPSKIKYRQLFLDKDISELRGYNRVESKDMKITRDISEEEIASPNLVPSGWKIFQTENLTSSGYSETLSKPFEYKGKLYSPATGNHWKTTHNGLAELAKANRLIAAGNTLNYKRYLDDFQVYPLTHSWQDISLGYGSDPKKYVVQTSTQVVKRCLLMTTDPGDLVLDITCGSGTTAYVAENWGRRWITCDTSRVAIALAKQRLMTANFDYFELAHPEEGVGSGFQYKTVPHITLKSIANNEPAPQETLYDQPFIDNKRLRVTGPFTMEAVPAPVTKSFDEVDSAIASSEAGAEVARSGETLRQSEWRDELLRTGVRAKGGKTIAFSRMEAARGFRYVQAEAETKEAKPQKVYVVFGPEHAPLEQRTVELAYEEVKPYKPDILLFCALQFDEEAAKDIDEMNPEITRCLFLKAQMNADLFTDDLKKKRASNESFWLIGQPDVKLKQIKSGDDKGKYQVEVNGFDYYNPKTGNVESGGKGDIAMWMLDTDYDGRSLFPSQVFFPMAGAKEGWATIARNLKAEIDEEKIEAFGGTVSMPFTPGKAVAVKIIDARGIESLKIIRL
ncbi:MAG: DNA methyltransferase, partial [Smithella sp.]